MTLGITVLTSSKVSCSSFVFTFLSDGFSDISITSLNLHSIFLSSSFKNLIYFLCQETSTDLPTDTQTSAASMRIFSSSSSIATSKSLSTLFIQRFYIIFCPTYTYNLSYLNFSVSMFCTCILNHCLVISLLPFSILKRCILSIYPLIFLSLSK